VQSAVDDWQQQARMQHGQSCLQPGPSTPCEEERRKIVYYSMLCVGQLNIPSWKCSCCSVIVTPPPSAFACFPATPVIPTLWYDVQVLQTYQRFGLVEGLSATGELLRVWSFACRILIATVAGFLAGLHHQHEYWSNDTHGTCRIKASDFVATFDHFVCVTTPLDDLTFLGVEGLDVGPFADCPVCASQGAEGGWVEGEGHPLSRTFPGCSPRADEFQCSIASDAVTKACHFSKCGEATKDIQPGLSTYFGKAEAEVKRLHEAKK
jgi:hypothetical protein